MHFLVYVNGVLKRNAAITKGGDYYIDGNNNFVFYSKIKRDFQLTFLQYKEGKLVREINFNLDKDIPSNEPFIMDEWEHEIKYTVLKILE